MRVLHRSSSSRLFLAVLGPLHFHVNVTSSPSVSAESQLGLRQGSRQVCRSAGKYHSLRKPSYPWSWGVFPRQSPFISFKSYSFLCTSVFSDSLCSLISSFTGGPNASSRHSAAKSLVVLGAAVPRRVGTWRDETQAAQVRDP